MNEDVQLIFDFAKENMEKAIVYLDTELSRIRAGKANIHLLDGIYVDYYGTLTPLNQVSSISTPDAKTLSIQPWEKNMITPIEKAILASNIGLTPANNGELIRLNIPPLTEERRLQLVKQVKHEGENAKVSIRTARRDANDEIKTLQKDSLSEDLAKKAEVDIQKVTDEFNLQVDKIVEAKEKEMLTI